MPPKSILGKSRCNSGSLRRTVSRASISRGIDPFAAIGTLAESTKHLFGLALPDPFPNSHWPRKESSVTWAGMYAEKSCM